MWIVFEHDLKVWWNKRISGLWTTLVVMAKKINSKDFAQKCKLFSDRIIVLGEYCPVLSLKAKLKRAVWLNGIMNCQIVICKLLVDAEIQILLMNLKHFEHPDQCEKKIKPVFKLNDLLNGRNDLRQNKLKCKILSNSHWTVQWVEKVLYRPWG